MGKKNMTHHLKDWEEMKALLYECDEHEFAANRDKLFAGIDRLRVNEILHKIKEMLSDLKHNPISAEELKKARDYAHGIQR